MQGPKPSVSLCRDRNGSLQHNTPYNTPCCMTTPFEAQTDGLVHFVKVGLSLGSIVLGGF